MVDMVSKNERNVRYEILDGKIFYMAPPAGESHHNITDNITTIFKNYLKGKPCRAYSDGPYVHLDTVDVSDISKKDKLIPDVMIVCNKDIIKKNFIAGAPDLIVEVLSPSTAKNDIGYKKDLYAEYGVKEYWIISQEERSVQVYILKDGVYKLDNIYRIYEDWVLEGMDEEEKSEIIKEFKTSLYDDLIIKVEEVFENVE